MIKKPNCLLLLSTFILSNVTTHAQTDFKYGGVTAELFKTNKYNIDSNDTAIFYLTWHPPIYPEGNSDMEIINTPESFFAFFINKQKNN